LTKVWYRVDDGWWLSRCTWRWSVLKLIGNEWNQGNSLWTRSKWYYTKGNLI
jgi:hypothetical protein